MSEQATIDCRPADVATARAVGEAAGQLALDRAEREAAWFRERCIAAILQRLETGPASAEELTEHVRACGIPFKDGRALGPIYKAMKNAGLICIVGECARRFGHGSGGGHIWARCC